MPDDTNKRSEWLRQARWGVMTHYLASDPGSGEDGRGVTAEEWSRQVDAFALDDFVDQVVSTGAGYLIFTVGQNTGHYCSPNSAYDEITGFRPSRCSRRDLIAELAESLAARGVRLLVYCTTGAPSSTASATTPSAPPAGRPSSTACWPGWSSRERSSSAWS